MFATLKSHLIPEPRKAEHPRHYVGRHRRADPAAPSLPASISGPPAIADQPEIPAQVSKSAAVEETAVV